MGGRYAKIQRFMCMLKFMVDDKYIKKSIIS